MKYTLVFMGMLVLSFSSCKKDMSCECITTHTNFLGTTTGPVETTTYKKIKKSEAKTICQKTTHDYNSATIYGSGGSSATKDLNTYDCKLK